MRVIQIESAPPRSEVRQVLAIGKFDGVHIGHQAILETAKQHLNGARLAVMSFTPHPMYVLGGKEEYRRVLTPPVEKAQLLAQHGVDHLYEVHFTDAYARTSAEDFVRRHLTMLTLDRVVVGEDFRFGQGGTADAQVLTALCREIGVPVTIVRQVEENGSKVSSSQIRAHLAAGRVEAAEALLGRAYSITGQVVHGDHLGRTIGFPTANIGGIDEYVLPKTGVYTASVALVDRDRGAQQNWFAVVNAGLRPTVGGGTFRLEAHLLDFSGDLYGRAFRVSFLRRIRDEQKFSSLDALREQIEADCALAREMLGLEAK